MILREMLCAKIHGAIVTDKNLHYTGSLSVDARLLDSVGMLANEKVQVINLNNSERMWTYLIRAEPGCGKIGLNGGMAYKGEIGDRLLLITYAQVDEEGLRSLHPKVLVIEDDNRRFRLIDA
jgi:aspartate 1-decarboxylase